MNDTILNLDQLEEAARAAVKPDRRKTLYAPGEDYPRDAFTVKRPNGTVEVLYRPSSEKHRNYHASNVPKLIMEGRRGTGKSHTMRWDFHMRAMAYPGYKYLMLRRTMPELRKALALDTPIPTPRGWTTMGRLREGDEVFAVSGTPTRVLWKSEAAIDEHGSYRVTFDNGESIIASAGHKWMVSTRMQRRLGTSKVRTTEEIARRVHTEHDRRSNYAVRVASEWQCGAGANLPVDPYVLGAWLGDGTKGQGAVTSYDDEVVQTIRDAGYDVRERPAHSREWSVRGLMAQLRALGVLHDKRVPNDYWRGSRSQRLALLQGLMDTDGWCREDGWCAFAQTNERQPIAEAVFRLAASLGLKPHWNERPARLGDKDCGTSYEVSWSGDVPVFRLTRKRIRLKARTRCTTDWHYIVAVERVADTLCQCIAVDHPSHQFLAGHGSVPTHNSHLLYLETDMDKLDGRALGVRSGNVEAHYTNSSLGLFGHCETEADVLKYLSAQFDAICFDEITTFDWEMVTRISTSCRVLEGSGLIAVVRGGTNPLGVSADEVYHYFIAKDITSEEDPNYDVADWGSLHIERSDSDHIDYVQYDKQFAGLSKAYREAWLEGKWGVEGAYFTIEDKHIAPSMPSIVGNEGLPAMEATRWPWLNTYRVLDYGWHDPTVCVWIAVLPDGREIAFQEYSTVRTPAQTVAADLARLSEGMRIVATIADPTLWDGEKEMGHCMANVFEDNNIPLTKGKNDRTAAGFAIQEHLNTNLILGRDWVEPKLQIIEARCPTLTKTLRSMRVDKKHPGRIADHKADHMPIALGYFCMANVGPTRIPQESTERPWMRPINNNRRVLGASNVRRRAHTVYSNT